MSYTELSTLAKCEMMWALRYRDKVEQPDEPRPIYFRKGTMLHELIHAWWIGGDAQVRAEAAQLGESEDFDHAALQDDVQWLYDRYTTHYGELRARGAIRVVETELKVINPLPHTDVSVVTYVDQLVWVKDMGTHPDGLYVVERKSMADWQRLDTIDVDPQVGIAMWQLANAGWPVKGVLYDAMRTYRWKPEKPTQAAFIEAADIAGTLPEFKTQKAQREWAKAEIEASAGDERPLEDSFNMLWLDRSAQQIVPVVTDMRAAVRRRAVLGAGEVPMRNIGTTCRTCSFRNECHADLIFPELFELRYEQA